MPSKFESYAVLSSPSSTGGRRSTTPIAGSWTACEPGCSAADEPRYETEDLTRSPAAARRWRPWPGRFCRTRASIYRVIGEMRARRIMELPLDFVPNDRFARLRSGKAEAGDPRSAVQRRALEEAAGAGRPAALPGQPVRGPAADARAGGAPVPANELLEIQGGPPPEEARPGAPRPLPDGPHREMLDLAVNAKNHIIRANLRLVVSIAKRQFGPGETFFELVSDGNMSLMRAVEKFDFARGYKFSTYASSAIMKNFARTIPERYRHCDRFRTSQSAAFDEAADVRLDGADEGGQFQRESQVATILSRLNPPRTEDHHPPLRPASRPRAVTLKQVGAEMGVTRSGPPDPGPRPWENSARPSRSRRSNSRRKHQPQLPSPFGRGDRAAAATSWRRRWSAGRPRASDRPGPPGR